MSGIEDILEDITGGSLIGDLLGSIFGGGSGGSGGGGGGYGYTPAPAFDMGGLMPIILIVFVFLIVLKVIK